MRKDQNHFGADNNIHVLVPAYNESDNIADVVAELLDHKNHDIKVVANVVVCDNASSDDTAALALAAGAVIVHETKQGYGAACLRAIDELPKLNAHDNDIIVFVDGDHSVLTPEIDLLIEQCQQNRGLVIGSRNTDQIEHGAMSAHQRIGNFIASRMIQWIWQTKVTDLGPFRAMHYRDLKLLKMQDEKFGWTTEMQVKVIQLGLPYSEVAVSTRKRRGQSKISGTLRGTIGAAYGIFSTIFLLWWQARKVELLDQLNS